MSVFKILVGSYTSELVTLAFDTSVEPPTLSVQSTSKSGQSPSWIAVHPSDPSLVFATNETTDGKVQLFKLQQDGTAQLIEERSSGGADPAHLAVSESEVIVGNYSGGQILSIPLSRSPPYLLEPTQDAIPFQGSGPNTARQEGSHPHQIFFHPTREEVLILDLGTDKIWRLLKEDGKWSVKDEIKFPPGTGPRHAVVDDDVLYSVGELNNLINTHKLPPLPESPTFLSSLSSIKSPREKDPIQFLSEILLSPTNASFPNALIYVANREDPLPEGDTISIYTPHSSSQGFQFVESVATGFNHLRGMAFGGPDDKYLIAGGQNGGGIKVFERTGTTAPYLKEVAKLEGVEKPTGFLWI